MDRIPIIGELSGRVPGNPGLTRLCAERTMVSLVGGPSMKRSSGPRKTANLSESVHHQLNMYTLAAGAAGVGALALAQTAEARIVYTPAHVTIGLHDSYKLDLNHDGIADFTILNTSYHNTSTWFYRLSEKAAQGNAVVASSRGQQELAEALYHGARIPAGHVFYHKPALLASAVYNPGGTFSAGNWVNVQDRYLGPKFQIKGKTHFGWARLNVAVHGTSVTGTLNGYAYEPIPGKPIIAGRTKGPGDIIGRTDAALGAPTPKPASLALLALGSPALSIWRR